MSEALLQAVEAVRQALTIGTPCIGALRTLRTLADEAISADEADTQRIAHEWTAEIFASEDSSHAG